MRGIVLISFSIFLFLLVQVGAQEEGVFGDVSFNILILKENVSIETTSCYVGQQVWVVADIICRKSGGCAEESTNASITIPTGFLLPNNDIIHKNPLTPEDELWVTHWVVTCSNTTGEYTITVQTPSHSDSDSITVLSKPVNPKLTIFGTAYKIGEDGIIWSQLLDQDGTPVNLATCNLSVSYPNGSLWVDNSSMTYLAGSNGRYNYSFTVPDTIGIYSIDATCVNPVTFSSGTFHVAPWIQDIGTISSIVTLINTTVQAYDITLYGGGTYNANEQIQIVATLMESGIFVSGATLNITVYYPNGLKFKNSEMNSEGSGIYSYNFTAPTTVGDYRVDVFIGNSNAVTKFSISTIRSILQIELEATEDVITDKIKDSTRNTEGFITGLVVFLNSNTMQGFYVLSIIVIILFIIALLRRYRNDETPQEASPGPPMI